MDIVGKEIVHANKLFGVGTITSFDGTYLCAYFPSKEKECKLSIEPAFIKLYSFPDEDVAHYIESTSEENEIKKKSVSPKSNAQEVPFYELYQPVSRMNSDNWSIHNIIKDNILQSVIVCASTRSFCVHKDFIYENRKHNVEMRHVIVGCLDRDGTANIGAEYCFDCNEYKIDEYSIYFYEDKYGKLILLRQKESSGGGSVAVASMNWDAKTKLSKIGYTVKETGGYTEQQRHRLLSYIIDNELMQLPEVTGTIRQARNMKMDMDYKRSIFAINKWGIDLDFMDAKYIFNQKANKSDLRQPDI